MARYSKEAWKGKHLFVGIDVHRKRWHVTVRSEDGLVLFSNGIDARWEELVRLLSRFSEAGQMSVVYEAGYFGFWLYDRMIEYGVDARVTPPHLIPQRSGNRVKNDRLDSGKLAEFLQSGLLTALHVPTVQERAHRQGSRRRRQMIGNRVRSQNRIKAELRVNGIELPRESRGKWSQVFVDKLRAFRFQDRYQQDSFQTLLNEFDFHSEQIQRQTNLLMELSKSEKYRDRVEILTSTPGIGWISAMELLLEPQDVARFQRADRLAAYVGLTPSQYSTGEKLRLGHITRQGKSNLRALLVEAAWRVIKKDGALRQKYERIKIRAGSKRAIVAIARMLIIRLRRILIHKEMYALGLD